MKMSGQFEVPPIEDTVHVEGVPSVKNSSVETVSAMGDSFSVQSGRSFSEVTASSGDLEKFQRRQSLLECECSCHSIESSGNSSNIGEKNNFGRCSKFISDSLLSSLVAKVPRSTEQTTSAPNFRQQDDRPIPYSFCLFGQLRRFFSRKKTHPKPRTCFVTAVQPISHKKPRGGSTGQRSQQPTAPVPHTNTPGSGQPSGSQRPMTVPDFRERDFRGPNFPGRYANWPLPMRGTTPVNCSGLQCLDSLDGILIFQEVQLIEVAGGWKQENRYRILTMYGDHILNALEHSDVCQRQCCCENRSLRIEILDGTNREVIRIIKPYRLSCYCCCCCLQNVTVESPPGSPIGRIRQKCNCLRPRLKIFDANKTEVFFTKGPACPTCNCCMWYKSSFPVYSKVGKIQVGLIRKLWAGDAQEVATGADNFEVIFPFDLEVRLKAMLIATGLVIDYMHYDSAQGMLKLYTITSLIVVSWSISTPCRLPEFQCKHRQCIYMNKYCNGLQDCTDGSDEPPHCTPCNMTYYGEVGRTYELEVKRPSEEQMPFLCYLNFTAGGGPLGELIQITFESFAVGTFESFTTEGCPEGYISIREGNRPSSHGKWCGSAWGYTVYYSETSNVNLTLRLDRFPQQQSSGYSFEFKLSYKFLKLSDARIRYGNATQKTYRGKLAIGTYCDRLLEGCSRRPCRIQSPNYPGIYPRNVSCNYRVRERNVPQGKHALIAVRQANFHYKEHVPKFDNSDRVFRIWDQCNMMQDYIEILDGWGPTATTLAHLCSGETVPDIISSGPELLVRFHTSPYGNPFHPLPLSYLPGFELEVQVFYVKKESPTYIEHGKKCEFLVSTFENTSGLLESPLHSLPPNTTCHYHFRGQPKDIVWISFIKYHVTNERQTDFNAGECDVQLQIWDGDIKSKNSVPLMGQFCKDDKPKLCDHSLLKNSSRLTRPCGLAESYVSSGPDMTIVHSIRYGSVMYPVNFVLRYEFVDLSQEGIQMTRNPCDRIFKDSIGKFYSPRITFLYGRGGQKDLTCTYQFESQENQRLKLTFLQMSFADKNCMTTYNPEIDRYLCYIKSYDQGIANIQISEYPWPGVEILRDCFCSNISEPVSVITKTSYKVVVKFTITNMKITDDHNNYFFDANYAFIPAENNCVNPWKTRRLRGSSGEITVRNSAQSKTKSEHLFPQNQTVKYCLHQPWLIEPEDSLSNFIYLKIRGTEKRDSRLCPSKNRVLVYPAGKSDDIHIVCPHYESIDDVVEMFSEGWSLFSYRKLQNKHSRSFIIEFIQREPGNFVVTWMEVSKNPALMLPSSLLMMNAPDCPHSCPELGACISSELWCDGLRHCPSGNDEQESNCSIHGGFPISFMNSIALSAVAIVIIVTISTISFYFFKHWKREQKNVIVSVTEHTFLEFKSGYC